MGSDSSTHLSDEQLARFQDGELSAREAGHLATCPQCANRLRDLEAVGMAYAAYRDAVREPLLPPAPKPWVHLERLVERHEAGRGRKALRWWLVPSLAAAVCAIVAVALVLRNGQQPYTQVSELLERSADAELSQAEVTQGRLISVRAYGRNLVRPAVLITDAPVGSGPDLEHLQMVFAAANYSWREPLSPRSFQAWRRGLKAKRDAVSMIGEAAEKRSYRVRTESPSGTLRSASLTLRAQDLHPTDGTFEFEGEGKVELTETSAPAPAPKQETAPRSSTAQAPPAETPAAPEDTLRVLAALNEIGADVGEPIALSNDPQDPQHRRVLVHAGGLSQERRRQVAEALKPLPRVALDFDSDAPGSLPAQPAAPERFTASIPAPLRQRLEDRLGGAIALQEITDRVLETSASALARTHAVQVLGQNFPPEVESRLAPADRALLRTLRNRHLAELERLATRIRADLKPLLAMPGRAPQTAYMDNGLGPPWQSGVPSLVASAQETDSLLNRLLAGSYSQSEGESMLHGLAAQLDRLDWKIQSQQRDGR